MTEEALFKLALNTPEAERPALLDRECAGNPALRARIEARLAADATGSFGDPDSTASHHPASVPDETGTLLAGKYKLLERIGEGGMGSVWMAQQSAPVKRKVAVKLIKPGMDSRLVIARFEAERQALAMMDHPNIAKVLDGGLTPDGRPFFVMELVKGVPITEYCDRHKLTPQQRLELFVPVTQAIQHAHQKGIIHRDIKPSNVLIALYDDKPVPKVIDFGVAKATGQQLTEHTINTGFGGIVGTPQYMSPEQATFNNLDIDTRSDVYSLGILLYELLAGSPPFSRKELENKGLLEILRVVREEEPPKPSTKLSTADALPTLSANRGTDPHKLTALLRSELDWIVLKALEKDRTRRYETANGFAADVNRYLTGEAVLAHPPSKAYRVRKFVRKHRGPVIAAGVVALALLMGIAGTTWGLIQARNARTDTLIALNQVTGQESKARIALQAERKAKEQARKTISEMADAILDRHRKPMTVVPGVTVQDSWKKVQLSQPDTILANKLIQEYTLFAEQLGEDLEDRKLQASCFSHISHICDSTGDFNGSVNAIERALLIHQSLAASSSDSEQHSASLPYFHQALAEALHQVNRHDEALANWERAFELVPTDERDRMFIYRAGGRARAGRITAALADVEVLLQKTEPEYYNCACVLALAASAVKHDSVLQETLAARAMSLLKTADAHGAFPADDLKAWMLGTMKFDSDLDFLRNRDDFRAFVTSIEARYAKTEILPAPRIVK